MSAIVESLSDLPSFEVSDIWDKLMMILPIILLITVIIILIWWLCTGSNPKDSASLVLRRGQPRRLITSEGSYFLWPFLETPKTVHWSMKLGKDDAAAIANRIPMEFISTKQEALDCETCVVESEQGHTVRFEPVLSYHINSPAKAFKCDDLPYSLRSHVLSTCQVPISEEDIVSPPRLAHLCDRYLKSLNNITQDLGVECLSLKLTNIVYLPTSQSIGHGVKQAPDILSPRIGSPSRTMPQTTTAAASPVTPQAIRQYAEAQAEAIRLVGDAHCALVERLMNTGASPEVLKHATALQDTALTRLSSAVPTTTASPS